MLYKKNLQPSECEEPEEMSEGALRDALIDQYVNLQRIKAAPDRDKEIEYQIKIAKAKLQVYGVDTRKLEYE